MNTVKVFHEVDLFSMEGNGPESKSKSCSAAHKLQDFKTLAYKICFDGYFVKAGQSLVHKGEVHQHPERICAKILHKMRLVF